MILQLEYSYSRIFYEGGDMMQPYQERLLIEYVELYDKRRKLSHIIKQSNNGTLNFELSCDIDLLMAQCAVMDSYLCILKLRVKQEHLQVELEECICNFFKHEGGE